MTTTKSRLVHPPLDYSVTLAEVADFHIKHNTSEIIYTVAEDGKETHTDISFLEFGRAVHRVAHYVRPYRSGPDRQTIAFVGLTDSLLYQAVTIGIAKAGYIPYPMSPRNTAAAIIKLMKDTSCHRLLTTQQTLRSLVEDIKSQLSSSDPDYALQIDEVPSVSSIFPNLGHEKPEDSFQEYPTGPRPPLTDVLLYLHSSGSTGLPKTIPQTFKSMVDWANLPSVTDLINHKVPLRMSGHALPPFHTLGIIATVLCALYAMVPVGLFPPTAIAPHLVPVMPTPHNILDHITRTRCNSLVIIPALLQIWAQDKKAVELLASLEFVGFSGGSVPSKLGNFMTESGVYITPVYGATEFGAPTRFFRLEGDEKDWEYIFFSERSTIRWDPQGDDTFEAQFLTTDAHQVSIQNLPDIKGYATSDLFVQHPTKPYFWKIVGRKDDVLIHTSGEKTVPGPMEDILMSSPYIMGVIIFGRERDQAGVLIELKPPYQIDVHKESELIDIRNKLWPIVEEANKVAPAFSRIFKEMILISSKDKPLARAGKGTVMRKAALADYASEIDEIYAKVEATANVEAVVPPTTWDMKDVSAWLLAQISEMLGKATVSANGDLFEQGMDSLGATILRRRIVSAMQSTDIQKANQVVSQATIYENPSIEKLAAFISAVVKDPDAFVLTSSKTDAIELMINKYSAGLDTPIAAQDAHDAGDLVVLLTGSTGNLGSQLLESLLRDPKVKTVYALNRPSSGSKSIQQRHADRFADKALDSSLLSSDRLVYVEGEASHRNLGLKDAQYNELRSKITTIIHNAWRLDFNLALSSFEPNVQGTRNLIDLARSSNHASSVKFLFTSSVSSAISWDKSQGPYPEEILKDSKYAVGNGYGESKYVVERILGVSGLRATSFRIGQISGGLPNGAWSITDWVPILVKSSIHMNALPSASGVVSWVPMNSVSQAILEVAHSTFSSDALNIVHPRPVPWTSIAAAINEAIVKEGVRASPLPVVNMQTWVAKLKELANDSSSEILNKVPAIKLLDFFSFTSAMDIAIRGSGNPDIEEIGGLATFSTTKAQEVSETMWSLAKIGPEDAGRWVKYWKGVGYV